MRTIDEQVAGRKLTPMLVQLVDAKRTHPEALLMFRMGDFYELFFDDAKIAAEALELTLTSRDKSNKNDPIPMAGVPHHALPNYVARLVKGGFNVAICEQVEDPKTAKGIVKREITRLVTPGTICEIDAMEPGKSHYLAAIVETPSKHFAVVLLDILAGEVLATFCSDKDSLVDELLRMGAKECLTLPETTLEPALFIEQRLAHRTVSPLAEKYGNEGVENRALGQQKYIVSELVRVFGSDEIAGVGGGQDLLALQTATVMAVQFAEHSQRRRLPHLERPTLYWASDYLLLDGATRRNLELFQTLSGEKKGSLLAHLDHTATAMGSRLLAHWVSFPLCNREMIEGRLASVEQLSVERTIRQEINGHLKQIRDLERLMGRVGVYRATPREMALIRDSLGVIPALVKQFSVLSTPLATRWKQLDPLLDLAQLLSSSLVERPPNSILEGGIFATGHRDDLDELIALSTKGHGYLDDLEKTQREKTGISSLKVRYNKVFGYYIEISNAHRDQVPDDYIRKQTLVNAERYIIPELKLYESRVLQADGERKERERELYLELLDAVGSKAPRMRVLTRLLAETDALHSLATVADEGRYCKPLLSEQSVLLLEGSRHPVIECLLPLGESFIANDLSLDTSQRQVLLVTGPNMGGKSTVMRQAALVTLMAQMGSFVPCTKATVGIADRLFTRVGASDNLTGGQSTFMVEMLETAAILTQATAQSLVILDEIGRGTSTYDGLSLAWAVAEKLHDDIGCRTLFATHYHELTELSVNKERLFNVSVSAKKSGGRVLFLRQLVEGAANYSFGIDVAALAGVPPDVLLRARQVLSRLEQENTIHKVVEVSHDSSVPDLVSHPPIIQTLNLEEPQNKDAVFNALEALELDTMRPVDALMALVQLKKLAQEHS